MTTNTSELIASIRRWQEADKAYREVRDVFGATKLRLKTDYERDTAAQAVCSNWHDDSTLAAFVALADHCERLEAETARVLVAAYDLRAANSDLRAAVDASTHLMSHMRSGNYLAAEFKKQVDINVKLLTGSDDSASK